MRVPSLGRNSAPRLNERAIESPVISPRLSSSPLPNWTSPAPRQGARIALPDRAEARGAAVDGAGQVGRELLDADARPEAHRVGHPVGDRRVDVEDLDAALERSVAALPALVVLGRGAERRAEAEPVAPAPVDRRRVVEVRQDRRRAGSGAVRAGDRTASEGGVQRGSAIAPTRCSSRGRGRRRRARARRARSCRRG